MLESNERYLIDETTAVVRFIIPLWTTRRLSQEGFASAPIDAQPDTAPLREELLTIHRLFFALFVEGVAKTVLGEDEIWLLEQFGPLQALYVWERVE